jgi:putative transposase
MLTELSETQRAQALDRFLSIQPFLEGKATLTEVAKQHGILLRTAQRWVARFRQDGLAGLVRKRRSDQGKRRLPPELQGLIEGLALQKTKPSAASIHRQVSKLCEQYEWQQPSYRCVYDIVNELDPALVTLAHEGSKAYRDAFDLVYRRQANEPNQIWQADHSLLKIWLLDDDGQARRPWLTAIEDDYSRHIAGYYLCFEAPTTLKTALTLRQAIWRKSDPRWQICGIPGTFYSDHGSDFTSNHLEMVCADLKMELIHSIQGMPRGRGRVERFFKTVTQLFLHLQPGYGPEGKPLTPPSLTMTMFEERFVNFLLDDYHHRVQKDLGASPQERWETNGFLPRMPDTLEQLDLLLLTVAKTRRVRRDGIHFQTYCYLDPTLAGYVGEDVVIRYDPRDMAEIRVYHHNNFICQAICSELAGQTVTLKDIIRARNRRRRQLREEIKDREALVRTYLEVHQPEPELPQPEPTEVESTSPPPKRLKGYYNE